MPVWQVKASIATTGWLGIKIGVGVAEVFEPSNRFGSVWQNPKPFNYWVLFRGATVCAPGMLSDARKFVRIFAILRSRSDRFNLGFRDPIKNLQGFSHRFTKPRPRWGIHPFGNFDH